MPNQKIKTTTLKRLLNRKVRGMENMMWAVIALIIVVVVAVAMWSIISSSASTVNAPQVQIVPQESFILGNTANVTLKFGKGLQGVSVSLAVPKGNAINIIASSCQSGDLGVGSSVSEGQKVRFKCTLNENPASGIIYVIVKWKGGDTTIKWVVG
jgi:hypothetical protein